LYKDFLFLDGFHFIKLCHLHDVVACQNQIYVVEYRYFAPDSQTSQNCRLFQPPEQPFNSRAFSIFFTEFDTLFDKGLTEEGNAEAGKAQGLYGERGDGKTEFNADTFAQFWNDPEFWKEVTTKAEAKQAGMGQKFIKALDEFVRMVRSKLNGIGTPEAKVLFDNLGELRASAVESLAEYKRRAGTSTDAENVVGAKGSHTVESVKMTDLNIDPARFQFKSKADKKTGVDESNQLGGEFDPKTAGNLYAWEDRDGKKFVVNGHHRYKLARDSKVESVNAIVDREADGVTANQAKRNGVLINIRDEQGDISDYASFVRSEKMDVSVGKRADKLLNDTLKEQSAWEN